MPDKPNSFGDSPTLEEVKQMRREYPSGWLELTMYESLALMIDAIIDAPPDYSFSNPELAERAGISAESVRNHIGTLEELGVVSPAERASTFMVNENSRVLHEIFGLNDAVNTVRSGRSLFIDQFSSGLSDEEIHSHIPEEEGTTNSDVPSEKLPGSKEIGGNTAFSAS